MNDGTIMLGCLHLDVYTYSWRPYVTRLPYTAGVWSLGAACTHVHWCTAITIQSALHRVGAVALPLGYIIGYSRAWKS